jgi:hypothetical protein
VKSNDSQKSTAASESEAQPEPEPEPCGSKSRAFTFLELLCVFFWFLLDGFWLLEWKFLTYAFSVVAIVTAFLMFWFIKKERVIVLVACADTCWLILNILWAVGDLSKIPQALLTAKIFFVIGGIFCFAAFCVSEARERLHFLVLSRLRILKFFQRTRMI